MESAGSTPTRVNPAAIEVMREIGLDLSAHRSKSVDTVDARQVHTVITLCAEEVCPVFLGRARRLHWPLPDPARVEPGEGQEAVLERFRQVRDAIERRLVELADQEAWGPALRRARAEDLGAVRALLAARALPLGGLEDHYPRGYAVAEQGGVIVGAAGLEIYGAIGLLRSVVVAEGHEHSGLGARLVEDRLEAARAQGLREVALLTTTAAGFFERLGFSVLPHERLFEELRAAPEVTTICPDTAVLMHRAAQEEGKH